MVRSARARALVTASIVAGAGTAILAETISSPLPTVTLGPAGVTIRPGNQSRRETLESLARLLSATVRWPPETPDTSLFLALTNATVEQALVRILDGLDWTVVWTRVPGADRAPWRPLEIRVGRWSGKPSSPERTPDLGRHDGIADRLEQLFRRLRDAVDQDERRALARAILAATATPADARIAAARWLDAGEAAHVRAVGLDAAARVADAALLIEIEQEHRGQGDAAAYANVLELIRRARSADAVTALIEWAGEIAAQPASPRARAALQGLASVGSGPSMDFLIEHFERGPAEVHGALREALQAAAPTEPALAALRSAAEGRRGVESDEARLAALDSLARFPDSRTVDLVRRLALTDASPAVRARAAELDQMWSNRIP